MRVVLLNPPAKERYVKESRCQHKAAIFQSVYPPLTLAYMAALMRNDNEAVLIDSIGEGMGFDETEESIVSFGPDLVIANTTTPTIENDLGFLARLKKRLPETRFCIFGIHATQFADELIKEDAVDMVIRGEPEVTAYEITKKPLKDVKGLVYKSGKRAVSNKPRGFLDLNRLPFPAWDMVNLESYQLPMGGGRYVLLVTGRGCPFQCTFCVSRSYYGNKFRLKTVENTIREIGYAKGLGINNFFFFTETFTLDRGFVMDLCREIADRGLDIKWMCNSRVDTFDDEMARAMKGAGCWLISFGLESADQGVLDLAKKGISLSQSERAIKAARDAGILSIGHFVIGLKGETEGTIKKTIEFSKKAGIDFAEFYISTPFPGSEIYDEFVEEYPGGKSWNNFQYSTSVLKTDLDLEGYRRAAYKSFYIRPLHMLRVIRRLGIRRTPRVVLTGISFIRSW